MRAERRKDYYLRKLIDLNRKTILEMQDELKKLILARRRILQEIRK